MKNTEAGELFVVMKARILIYMFKVVDTLSIFYPGLQNLPKNKIQRFLHLQDHLEDLTKGPLKSGYFPTLFVIIIIFYSTEETFDECCLRKKNLIYIHVSFHEFKH